MQKTNVWPVVGVVLFCVLAVALISLSGTGSSGSSNEKTTTLLVPVSETDHRLGASDAPVVVVEYADFQCPSCKLFSPMLARLVSEEGGRVAVVYRYFTLPQHANAIPAAAAAEAAGLQGKFWDMHDMLFDKQLEWESLPDTTATFASYAETIGLDMTKFTADVTSDVVVARVTQDTLDAKKNGYNHTPTLVLNGTEMANPASYEALKSAVEAAATAQ